ncbi:Methionyl-tRNA formyltransferase [Streptomyces sp. WMMB 714]|uniref:enoyl-CoA hydratase-related protein n=1 Tax=Streptomyces sp. WMMB 714 TaxID=1286822 RepID=UPI0005F79536|nr:enoyl-CoA hydratase-related protein [Streptomyces sp. WMMB 714]SCK11056.1 Methionyl-tRNA formyltransferase [Streptomyces sp. WMMB 714]
MRILLVASAFNSLTQRVHAELADRGHELDVVVGSDDEALRTAVRRHAPELLLAPMLKTAIPRDVWSAHTCLIVHPGPPGDRGPSSLDWAVASGAREWAVTVLEAEAEMDAGDVWASVPFRMPDDAAHGKSDIYRNEAADAAAAAVHLAVERYASGDFKPRSQHAGGAEVAVRPYYGQGRRRIDWAADPSAAVLRKLRAADSQPGVLDELFGEEWFLHGGRPEDELRGAPGEIVATRAGAICRATRDGAVWIPELRPRRAPGAPRPVKLPAARALGRHLHAVPEVPAPLALPAERRTWTDVRYEEKGGAGRRVGFLWFSFPGGAMSTGHCRRLLAAYRHALSRPTSVLVFGSPRDFFSNGIHLGVIEAAEDPALESWENIQAMDDLVEALLRTTDRVVVAALGGNAAAGGVMLALAADEVWCREGAVLNPHYRLMGLYGSEYWTYTLPRRAGEAAAARLMREAAPVSAAAAAAAGLVDRLVPAAPQDFAAVTARLAEREARDPGLAGRIAGKAAALRKDETHKPLAEYRREELRVMRRQFFCPEEPYHALRRAFVRKEARGAVRPAT